MLHKNVIEQKGGFRTLGVGELDSVSGGNGPGIPGADPILGQDDNGFGGFGNGLRDYIPLAAQPWTGGGDSEFESGKDYCGPEGNALLSWLVPDSIEGIDISFACYVHDQNYSKNSTMDRADADKLFGQQIAALLVAGGMAGGDALAYASNYYVEVSTFGGLFYKGSGAK